MAREGKKVQVENRREWRAWLEENHRRESGVWLVTFKKHCGEKYLPYEAIVEEALCFGWIDNLPRRLDDDRTMLWLTPRKKGSRWSRPNKERIDRLTRSRRMMPAGMEKVEAAKTDGTWTALDGVENLEIPADLTEALAERAPARKNFDAFPRSAKRGILEWIVTAKRPETRARRIAETARGAQENLRANEWRGNKP